MKRAVALLLQVFHSYLKQLVPKFHRKKCQDMPYYVIYGEQNVFLEPTVRLYKTVNHCDCHFKTDDHSVSRNGCELKLLTHMEYGLKVQGTVAFIQLRRIGLKLRITQADECSIRFHLWHHFTRLLVSGPTA